MSEEHYKGDGWDITVHERKSEDEPLRPFGEFKDYPYTNPFSYWWTDWTVNGYRVKEWWPKYNITKNMLVPLPEELVHKGIKGDLNLSDIPGEVEPCQIPPGLTDDETVTRAFYGAEVYEFLLQRRPVKVPEGYSEGDRHAIPGP